MFIIVDLPEPLGPMIATKPPLSIDSVTPASAATFTVPVR